MFAIEKREIACPTTDARICTYRDVYLVFDIDSDEIVEATWDPEDADATAALLNADDANLLAAA